MTADRTFTPETARAAAERNELAAWVAEFLASPGSDNAALAALLTNPPRWWVGPVRLPLDQLVRLAGPPDHPVLQPVEDHEWRDDVEDLAQRVDDGLEPAPVVVTFRDDRLLLEDGNHRVEALRRAGEVEAWGVVSFDHPAERDRFLARSEAADEANR